MNSVEELLPLLKDYKPISLEEMDSVALMDRFDTKFVFRFEHLHKIISRLKNDYQVLVVKNLPYATYRNLYYDTDNFRFFYQHHNGKGNRAKVRFREYVESKLSFFEIKIKNNKGKTLKSRVRTDEIFHELNSGLKDMVQLAIPDMDVEKLHSKLFNQFNRITLVSLTTKERVTIDFNLQFYKEGKMEVLTDMVVTEVKHEGGESGSPFFKLMIELRLKENSISKYCVGALYMEPSLRYNNFKEQLLTIQKLRNNVA